MSENENDGRIKVDVIRVGSPRKEVSIRHGATVECAIQEAGFGSSGHQLTVNGVGATGQTSLENGDAILMSPKIEGGR